MGVEHQIMLLWLDNINEWHNCEDDHPAGLLVMRQTGIRLEKDQRQNECQGATHRPDSAETVRQAWTRDPSDLCERWAGLHHACKWESHYREDKRVIGYVKELDYYNTIESWHDCRRQR